MRFDPPEPISPPEAGAWPFPFRDRDGGSLGRRGWIFLVAVFFALHFLVLGISSLTGNFDPQPNHDHVHVMLDVLEQGYPNVAIWPPGFGYYMAFKWWLTRTLGLPYWTGKLLVDWLPVLLSGVLSTLLGLRLTRNRFLGVASGLGLAAAPIFALASAKGLAALLFQPLFLAALLLLAAALQRPVPNLVGKLAAAGAVLGAACLVRANPQFLLLALAPLVVWGVRCSGTRRPVRWAVLALVAALASQALVLLPWSLLQRRMGRSGAFAAPVVYYAFFDGIRRHAGFTVSDALRHDPDPPPQSLRGVVDFNLEWLARDPLSLATLYGAKLAKTWYLSDSGRWDLWILVLHMPWWILAVAGGVRWLRRSRRDPALWLVLGVVAYMWVVSAAVSDLARYMAPVYGLLGLLAGVALLGFRRPAAEAT